MPEHHGAIYTVPAGRGAIYLLPEQYGTSYLKAMAPALAPEEGAGSCWHAADPYSCNMFHFQKGNVENTQRRMLPKVECYLT